MSEFLPPTHPYLPLSLAISSLRPAKRAVADAPIAAVTPLDVVRVRLQSQKAAPALAAHAPPSVKAAELGVTACCREVFFAGNNADVCLAAPRVGAPDAGDCAVQQVRRGTYSSTLDGLRKIARNEGVATLWRGLSPTLVMTIPANIIYFTGYDWLRHSPGSPLSGLSPDYAPLTAGSVARVLAATAVGPIELVRTRMQAASGASPTNHLLETFRGVRRMAAVHGYTALWRGLTLTLWRDVPFSGLYWWGYESIRSRLAAARRAASADPRRGHKHGETFVDSFAAGALSGAFASVVTTPFDVGKTRTQVHRDAPPEAGTGAPRLPERRNIVRLLWHIFKTEGARGLWKGWIPRTLKVAPACAIMISSYEMGKRLFRGVNERADKTRGQDG